MNRRSRSNIMLVLTAFIWGVAFVAQSVGMDYVGPYTFNGARFLIGGLVLIPCIFGFRYFNGTGRTMTRAAAARKRNTGIIGGICCGICLCIASALQQIGIAQTTVGKAGFITTLYIVIIPVLSIALGKKAGLKVWVSVAIAVAGMYLLSIKEGFTMEKGDFMVLLCAVVFSIHILVIDYLSPKADGVFMSCIQFFTAGIIAIIMAFIKETPTMESLTAAWAPVLYAGIMSSGVGYTLQVVAQKDTDPVVASLLLSLESVFSVLAGWVILHQVLSGRELLGCALVFCAVILAQLPNRRSSGYGFI